MIEKIWHGKTEVVKFDCDLFHRLSLNAENLKFVLKHMPSPVGKPRTEVLMCTQAGLHHKSINSREQQDMGYRSKINDFYDLPWK